MILSFTPFTRVHPTMFLIAEQHSDLYGFVRSMHDRQKLGAPVYRQRGQLLLTFFQPDDEGQVQCFSNIGDLARFFCSPTPSFKETYECSSKDCRPDFRASAVVAITKEEIVSPHAKNLIFNHLVLDVNPVTKCPNLHCDGWLTRAAHEVGKNYFSFFFVVLN